MKDFDTSILNPLKGELNGMIFDNEFLKIPIQIIYDINIPIKEFYLNDAKVDTSIKLDFIKLNIKSLEELEGKTFQFPFNPVEGYIDGSIYLFNVHNPFDLSKIEFGKFTENEISIKIHFMIDFEYEATSYKKTETNCLEAKLVLGKFRIDKEYVKSKNDLSSTIEVLGSFIALENIGEPIVESQNSLFQMHVRKI